MTNIGMGLMLRVCDLCGGVDDHPRHVIAGIETEVFPVPGDDILAKVIDAAPAADRVRLVRDLLDTASSDRHLDCCAAAGCPNGLCEPQVIDAPGIGAAMVHHLMTIEDRFADRPDVVKGA